MAETVCLNRKLDCLREKITPGYIDTNTGRDRCQLGHIMGNPTLMWTEQIVDRTCFEYSSHCRYHCE